jgi:hypothetical protein
MASQLQSLCYELFCSFSTKDACLRKAINIPSAYSYTNSMVYEILHIEGSVLTESA